MTTLNIQGKRVKVSDDFLSMSPAEQERTVDEIASSIGANRGTAFERGMGQLNRGIADSVGGLIDFVNPFDQPHALNPLSEGTGSAQTGIANAMQAGGVNVSQGAPQGAYEGFMRGAGSAAGAAIPAAGGAQVVRGVGGMVGGIADDAFRSLASTGGVTTEVLAGGVGGGAKETAKEMGAPEWAQNTAAVAAPGVAIPGAMMAGSAAARGAGRAAGAMPGMAMAGRLARDTKRALVPMTETGAREVARDRLQNLAGGPDRAGLLARAIEPQRDLNLTPAQQTRDPNLMGLERAAKDESPLLRERLDERAAQSRQTGREAVSGMGGDVNDARGFLRQRQREFRDGMQAWIDAVVSGADARMQGAGPRASETNNSLRTVREVRAELDDALGQEAQLWGQVPITAQVPTEKTRQAVERLTSETSWAQRRDLPDDLRRLFEEGSPFGDQATVREMHGLYSELRRQGRSAMAGNDKNKNRARIVNDVADAILKDLGAVDGTTTVGRAINEARAYSAALHETFDRGAVGRMLKRTLDGDETMTPEAALRRTVGRGGSEAVADVESIGRAAPGAADSVQDYLRGRFAESAMSASDGFTPGKARTWLRNNAETLVRFPALRGELDTALSSREKAAAFALRADARMKAAEDGSIAGFSGGRDDKAVFSILGADDPVQAARSVASAARKDASGKALAGVKGAFADHLIGQATRGEGLSGAQLRAALDDGRTASALRQVFDAPELDRLKRIAGELEGLDAKARDVGEVVDSPANRLIELVVRVAAAQHGGAMGGGSMGGSMQTANIFQERARKALRNLTNDKARQLLMDAVEDPKLFKDLLSEPGKVDLTPEQINRLAPYFTGAAVNVEAPENQSRREIAEAMSARLASRGPVVPGDSRRALVDALSRQERRQPFADGAANQRIVTALMQRQGGRR